MAHLVNKDFAELAADGSNYLTWAMDVKIMLTAKGYINTIEDPNPQAPVTDEAKYTTLYFLRHHIHPDLKNEYMMEENPRALWVYCRSKPTGEQRQATRRAGRSPGRWQALLRRRRSAIPSHARRFRRMSGVTP